MMLKPNFSVVHLLRKPGFMDDGVLMAGRSVPKVQARKSNRSRVVAARVTMAIKTAKS
jgi:hypothetical protein